MTSKRPEDGSAAAAKVTAQRGNRSWTAKWFMLLLGNDIRNLAFLLVLFPIVIAVAVFYHSASHLVGLTSGAGRPTHVATTCHRSAAANEKGPAGLPVKVSSATGTAAILNIYIGRHSYQGVGKTGPLAIENGGALCPNSILRIETGDFVPSSGPALLSTQIRTWAQVSNSGTFVTIWVVYAPHRGRLSDPGLYAGSVSLDSRVAQGGNVPVRIHIEYQKIDLAIAFSLLAAFGGFTWAWLLHSATGGDSKKGYFFRSLTLCLAVVLAAAIPIVNVQVLSKPDWQGSLTEYISLGTLVGAAAIAATPTLRALALPGRLGRQTTNPSPPTDPSTLTPSER
jgi:hypothetical protein